MKLHVKNMVCNRCKMVVKSELEKFGLHLIAVELGEVKIKGDLADEIKVQVGQRLEALGFVTKCTEQTPHSMCLFGRSFQFAYEYGYHH